MINRSPALRAAIIKSAVLFSLIGVAIFIYRYQIFQYSVEKIVRQYLPDYISVEKMTFNFKDSKIAFRSFKILNPPGFSGKYLIDIAQMECGYAMKGKNIMDGLEIFSPVFKDAVLYIERRRDALTNLEEMGAVLQKKETASKAGNRPAGQAALPANKETAGKSGPIGQKQAEGRGLSGFVKLPEDFIFKGGKVVFLDGMVTPGEYKITLSDINATFHMELDSAYTKVLKIATTGSGVLDGNPQAAIKWDTKYDPTASALTMSNRFNASGVDIVKFLPYYDRYSPLAIRSGYLSGVMVFDFDNGNIGSTNEILLSKFSFSVKRGFENAQFLESTVPDLVKYFTSASGDIVFDFKIKGPISSPQFYLGPISKQAIAAMAIDKIAQALAESANAQANPQNAAAAEGGSNMDKAAEYIKIFKGLMKENR